MQDAPISQSFSPLFLSAEDVTEEQKAFLNSTLTSYTRQQVNESQVRGRKIERDRIMKIIDRHRQNRNIQTVRIILESIADEITRKPL